ncbi:MAG TPA: hypothetical protein PKA45_01005 [Cyclobacteriaceae bacterium]|nr:hypothetical protein [Cyclobacteriaceae bacterium]HMV88968.1 hypothetical protein [Cyclobacteriaceae bacterium]HMW99217.1 hypothetical protein [Cyclobacteriaceae bacterium]HNA11815.1 hypothetical protein [Cyclobacteriaceae bacterium]HNC12767.1 hypothetical protein [Cyclobacteriaceae bacterium]
MVHSILDGKFTGTYDCNEPKQVINGDLIAFDEPSSLGIDANQMPGSFISAPMSQGWKLKDSFPSRIISISDDSVLLEIVKDAEKMITEERVFDKTLFDGYEIALGKFFKVRLFVKQNSIMIEIIPGWNVTEVDFPKIDFSQFSRQSGFN